mgnify:CR=1 FL=1
MVRPAVLLLVFVVLSAAAWWTGATVANRQADRNLSRKANAPRGRG